MKPAPFQYAAARSLPDALARLTDEDAKALAGGQSLIPLLNFRLTRPSLVVDLNPLTELSYLRRSGGVLRIGALTRQVAIERSALVAQGWPLLTEAVRLVGHPAIRTRGTIGGSVAHADPSAELPVAFTALDAVFHIRSAEGLRRVTAHELFRGPMSTSIAPHELLTEIEVPAVAAGARMAFIEHARTHGDFALAGAAVVLAPGEHAAIALLGAGATPIRATAAEQALLAGASDAETAELAGGEVRDEYRAALVTALITRALERMRVEVRG